MHIVFLVVLILLSGSVPTQSPDPDCDYIWERSHPDCDNGHIYDGYWWYDGWVPGLPDYDSWFMTMPVRSWGSAAWYANGVMEATARERGLDLDAYVGGVALTTCAHLGQTVWLSSWWMNWEWEGPYRVVDCARQNDIYGVIAYRYEIVEVDYRTALRWACDYQRKNCQLPWTFPQVQVSFVPPDIFVNDMEDVYWPEYWENGVSYMDGPADSYHVDWGRSWRLDGEEVWLPVWQAWYYEKEYWRLNGELDKY